MPVKTLARNTFIGFVILAILYFICYNWYDIPWMYFIYMATANTALYPLSQILSAIFAPECWAIAGAVALAYGFFAHKKLKIKKHNEACLRFGFTVITTAVLTAILKILIGRYRPEMLFTENLYGFQFFSFSNAAHSSPSGHATLSFCGFYCIARLLKKKWLTPFLLLAALIISFGKLVLADHYFSDILFGGYLGIISVLWMEVILNHTKVKWRPAKKESK